VCQLINPAAGIIPIHSECSDDFKKLPINDELKEKVITSSITIQGIEIEITSPSPLPSPSPEKRPSIFELFRIEYDRWSYDDGNTPQYPLFEVERSRIGLYLSLSKAEQAIKNFIEEGEKYNWSVPFGFLIDEYELDNATYWWTNSRRNYLPDGSLWDESLISDILPDGNPEEFLGRPADRVRFQNGDLVEILRGNTVELGIVGSPPRSPEEVIESNIRCKGLLRLDASDDCYYTLSVSENDDDDTHEHPSPACMFPVRFPVSDELRNNLMAQYERCCRYSE
jgi:hypothetical protein